MSPDERRPNGPCVDLRGTAPTVSPGGRRGALVWVLLLAGVGLGAASLAEGGLDEPQWLGLGIGAFCAVALVARVVTHLRPGARESLAARAGETRDVSGATVDQVNLARAGARRGTKLRGGVPATARILAVQDLHRSGSGGTLTYLELEVHHPTGCATIATGARVRPVQVAAITPGATLVVRMDPADPTVVAIDWVETLRVPEER